MTRAKKIKDKFNKKVRNATPLSYYGKLFKSKLELYCYKKLKDANLSFQYEAIKYEIVPNFRFKNDSYELFKVKGQRTFDKQRQNIRAITYTPDFVGYYPETNNVFIIETKGNPNDAFPLKWKLFKKYLNDTNLNIDLYMPRNQKQIELVINLILNKNADN
jgi:hypothetical protein